ncbi:DUF308 domain-containing protein [Streptomyces sp. RerS4]|uniref:DUF308 domain-containing protein n=1 Tax=Streptomyces sp. RerS4 TaxID=2942449 RepID=UPI00201C26F0|nr:DUF308 domain-containing protein [Streptomyces sp. RerS4]UQX04595.1 hypothetical protein M4D82_31845 [Streptomyces sp. RerS4]
MANTPEVSVGTPDDLGLRKVLIDGHLEGKARSAGELRRILDRAGVTVGHHDIQWLGGDCTVWPDRAGLRLTIRALMIFGFLATAYPLFHIGISDSGDALTYGGRVAGVTVLVAGVVELVAAGAAFDYWGKRRWRYSGVAVLAGVVLALLCGTSLLLLQIGERFTGYTLVGIALCVWSSAALVELVRLRAWKGLRHPQTVAIGVIISALLAGTNLAYSQIYLPYVRTPLIQSGAEFKDSNMVKGEKQLFMTVHLYVKNSGQVPVYLLDSKYWIHGGPASSGSDVKPGAFDLIYHGAFVTPVGSVLNPGEEIAQDVVVEVRDPMEHRYEAIRAQTEVYVIRKDRTKLPADYERSGIGGRKLEAEAKKEPGYPADTNYRYRSEISNSSEILNVTRGRQRITVFRVDSGEWPKVVVDVSPPDERTVFDPVNPYAKEEVNDRYGLSPVRGSTAQTPYQELLEKARSGG